MEFNNLKITNCYENEFTLDVYFPLNNQIYLFYFLKLYWNGVCQVIDYKFKGIER